MHLRRIWLVLSGAALLAAPPLIARPPVASLTGGEPTHAHSPTHSGAPRRNPLARLVSALTHRHALLAPSVGVEEVNSGAVVERDLCLTLSLGAAAAAECGDLRLVHALPTIRTLGRARTPVLLYNSQHASPHPLVAAHVTVPGGADRVEAVLTVNGQPRASRSWTQSWGAGDTRRIVLGYDAGEDRTGIYPYTLTVTAYSGGTATPAGSATGRLVVVNRKYSPFGAGWWVGGVEQLLVDRCGRPMYWIGGDGSVREYTATDCKQGWAAVSLDRPDSLKWNDSIQRYERILPGGVRVQFNAQGQHVATVNRLEQATRFAYLGERLASIAAPPAGRGRSYEFRYGESGFLQEIAAPGADTTLRVTRVRMEPVGKGRARRVTQIVEPTRDTVRFGYADASALRVRSRTDRRGTLTRYGYDGAGKVRESVVEMQGTGDDIRSTVTPLESLGMEAPVDTARAYTRFDGPRDNVADAADTTAFWLDRYGAPRRIVNALGYETLLTRADSARDAGGVMHSRYPALATRMRAPNGLETEAFYDARGNLDSTRVLHPYGDGRNAVTRYRWDPTWNFITRITLPEGEVTEFAYDPKTGNRIWQQDGRGEASRVDFTYNAQGLLESVISPPARGNSSRPRQWIFYDALGNLSETRTALGTTTLYRNDQLGRDTLTIVPVLGNEVRKERSRYDLFGQVLWTESEGLTANGAQTTAGRILERLRVTNRYDEEGNLRYVTREMSPDSNRIGPMQTEWIYDRAGRVTETVHPGGARERMYYNPAGLVVDHLTRRYCDPVSKLKCQISMVYDALGQLKRRTIPSVVYPSHWATAGQTRFDFPRNSLDPDLPMEPRVIPADTQTYDYDEMGRVRAAKNRDAWVRRGYTAGGLLRADTLNVRTYRGSDMGRHQYVLGYDYDLNGRLLELTYPDNLAPRPGAMARYGYDPVTGQLATVNDVMGNPFSFSYDLQGNLGTSTAPGQREEQFTYDLEGRPATRTGKFQNRFVGTPAGLPGGYLNVFRYDLRGKILSASGEVEQTNWYSGLGALATSTMFGFEEVANTYRYSDALGNVVRERRYHASAEDDPGSTWVQNNYIYAPGTGRLIGMHDRETGTSISFYQAAYDYDEAGNQDATSSTRTINPNAARLQTIEERTRLYYGADEKLRVLDRQKCRLVFSQNTAPACQSWDERLEPEPGIFEEYRYDALGRRILVRSRPDPLCRAACVASIERYVWSGDQILHEIRYPGSDGADLEQEAGYAVAERGAQPFGRITYTHGPGIDRPLSVVRSEHPSPGIENGQFTIIPIYDFRGMPSMGTFEDGSVVRCASPSSCTDLRTAWDWPSFTAFRRMIWRDPYAPRNWMGSLLRDKQDASGQTYMRNRYYDPNTGRFTQEDPIGLAGGINLYGFAGGDPVGYSDPYGLLAMGGGEPPNPSYPLNFGGGYWGRVDKFTEDGVAKHEIHVVRINASGRSTEVGVFGYEGWLARHGFDGSDPGLPRDVLNKVNGQNVLELRRRGVLSERGRENIAGGAYHPRVARLFNQLNAVGWMLDLVDAYQSASEAKRLNVNFWSYMEARMRGYSPEQIEQAARRPLS